MTAQTEHNHRAMLKAKRRMSFLLLALVLIFLIEAGITFPFVDHTTRLQNVLYGIIVTAPFIFINLAFIVLTGRDLKRTTRG